MKLRSRSSSLRCATCHGQLSCVEHACSSCGATLHADCSRHLGRCPTLGCSGAPHRRRIPRWPFLIAFLLVGGWLVSGMERAPREWEELVASFKKPASRLPRDSDARDVRAACIELVRIQPPDRIYWDTDLGTLPAAIRALHPTYVAVDRGGVTIDCAGETWFYYFESEPKGLALDHRWTRLADGLWQLVDARER